MSGRGDEPGPGWKQARTHCCPHVELTPPPQQSGNRLNRLHLQVRRPHDEKVVVTRLIFRNQSRFTWKRSRCGVTPGAAAKIFDKYLLTFSRGALALSLTSKHAVSPNGIGFLHSLPPVLPSLHPAHDDFFFESAFHRGDTNGSVFVVDQFFLESGMESHEHSHAYPEGKQEGKRLPAWGRYRSHIRRS
jgi:hypothetical protein